MAAIALGSVSQPVFHSGGDRYSALLMRGNLFGWNDEDTAHLRW